MSASLWERIPGARPLSQNPATWRQGLMQFLHPSSVRSGFSALGPCSQSDAGPPRDAGGRPPAALTSVGQRVLHLQLREPPTLGVWEAGSAWPSGERNLRKQPSPAQPGRWLEANPLLPRLTGSSVLPHVQNSFTHGESLRAWPQRTAAPPRALLVKETLPRPPPHPPHLLLPGVGAIPPSRRWPTCAPCRPRLPPSTPPKGSSGPEVPPNSE